MKHMTNGKAFEFALAIALEKIFKGSTNATIEESSALQIARKCFGSLTSSHQDLLSRAATESMLFLSAHDENIGQSRSIIIQQDGLGIKGDVRDIVIKTSLGDIGISAKHNHSAVKHSRLSESIDFGKEWTDYPCSRAYFNSISPIFEDLRIMKNQQMLFKDIHGKDLRIYLPILIAFEDEMKRLCENFQSLFVERLFRYLLGKYDFYKIILNSAQKKKEVIVQSVNIGGTLRYGAKWNIPNRIHSIARKRGSNNKIEIIFEGGWSISFRIHNASKKVEPSLKFDIQFVGFSEKATGHRISIV